MKFNNPIIPRPWPTIIISLVILLVTCYLTFDYAGIGNYTYISMSDFIIKPAKQKNTSSQNVDKPSLSAEDTNSDDIGFTSADIMEWTNEDLHYLDDIIYDPFIKYIRMGINNYLNNTGQDTQLEDLEDCGLSKFKEYLSGKYVAFQMEAGKYGGQIIHIIFRDKPDRVFMVWVYHLADESGNSYDLRAFCDTQINKNRVEILVKAFGGLLRNDEMAL